MTRVVCIVCDVVRRDQRDTTIASWCDGCGRLTQSREVASDAALIAPGSALRFRDQRDIYETTKPKREDT